MCRGNATPRGIPPPPPLVPNFTLTSWPRVSLPLTSHCSSWQHCQVYELTVSVHLISNKTHRAVGWTDTLWWRISAKINRQGEEEREREAVGGRWGILAENRTLVIFSFRKFLCLAGTCQVAANMKEVSLSVLLSAWSVTLDAWDNLHNLTLDDWLSALYCRWELLFYQKKKGHMIFFLFRQRKGKEH